MAEQPRTRVPGLPPSQPPAITADGRSLEDEREQPDDDQQPDEHQDAGRAEQELHRKTPSGDRQ
jgi:hypothetical protein